MTKAPTVLLTTSMVSPQSGAYSLLINTFRGIQQIGYRAILVLPPVNPQLTLLNPNEADSVRFISIPKATVASSPLGYLRFLIESFTCAYKLAEIIRKEKADIVHINEILDVYGALAANLSSTKCLWSIRAELSPWPLANVVLPYATTILANKISVASQSVVHCTYTRFGMHRKKVTVLYDPIDYEVFDPLVDGASVRSSLEIDPQDPVVLLVAKLARRKGHNTFIHAMPTVLQSFPNTHFLIVGGELAGDQHRQYADELRSLVNSLGIADSVKFLGYRNDIPEIMAAANVVVHCSTYPDPFPGVVLQAMAIGKPVIATNLGGTTEQIEDGVSGILVQPGSAKELATNIVSLLNNSRYCRLLGTAASDRVRRKFGSQAYFQQLDSLYQAILNR